LIELGRICTDIILISKLLARSFSEKHYFGPKWGIGVW